LLSYYDIKQRRYICRVCGDKAKISSVIIAYAFKLLLQEMMSLNVAPRLLVREKV
jgi:DNA-directed RNA polymerase subunit B